MSSPHDAPVLSSSPPSIRGISPVRRRDNRESFCQTDLLDGTRPHISPALVRSYDPNDPHVRERQRTLDVDMALHLSRARRETIATPLSTSYESAPHPEAETPFSHFSALEQHDIDMARGDRISHLDGVNGGSDGLHSPRSVTPIDLRMQHLDQTHDPALLATMGSEYRPIRGEALVSMPGLPVYEASVTRSVFAFAHLEVFAAQEKAELGISSPTDTQGSGFRLRRPTAGQSGGTEFTASPPGGAPAFDAGLESPYRSNRQRKLSQSSPVPRHNRKGIRGKMALFENHGGDPNFSFPNRLGPGHLSAIPSSENLAANQYSSGGMGGVISPGHDRPYRFSFYSNALSATIHARSLSELPAEGQSFEDLFTGLPPPDRQRDTKGNVPPVSYPIPVPSSHQGPAFVNDTNKRPVTAPPDSTTPSYNGSYLGRPEKGGAGNLGPPNSVGGGGELEGNTWWLDVQSPTDEEMKILSKVLSI
jgi:magnesium transporter